MIDENAENQNTDNQNSTNIRDQARRKIAKANLESVINKVTELEKTRAGHVKSIAQIDVEIEKMLSDNSKGIL